jgi:CRISPR system Cascade subunit CasA
MKDTQVSFVTASSPFSILSSPWLPIRRHSSSPDIITPAAITANHEDPATDLAWPRADFRIAGLEMLIGLLATCCPPEDDEAWLEWWRDPPGEAELQERFAPFAPAFILDGDGSRFLQDHEDFAGAPVPVERLLIDAPGENTVKKNADLLVKRDRVPLLGRAAAAMALYTLQTFAPSGGAGHRTSLRGGGPLTTLVIPPRDYPSLWHKLWANVPNGASPLPHEWPKVFPWLAPTRQSASNVGTALSGPEAHPLQAFWGMPRRIRLNFRTARSGEICGLTGRRDEVVVEAFRTRPWGVQYVNSADRHPLSPTYRSKPGEPPLSVHPQPDGVGYRHWVGLVEPGATSSPATTVTNFINRRPRRDRAKWEEASLLIAGYDMDNMKARGFIEAEMPLFCVDDPGQRAELYALARRLAEGATEAAGLLRFQLHNALQINTDRSSIETVRARFFETTTAEFWTLLRDALAHPDKARDAHAVAVRWLAVLRPVAMRLFDKAAPLDPLDPRAVTAKDGKPPPIVSARKMLSLALHGYGKGGEALFKALGHNMHIPVKPVRKKARADG